MTFDGVLLEILIIEPALIAGICGLGFRWSCETWPNGVNSLANGEGRNYF